MHPTLSLDSSETRFVRVTDLLDFYNRTIGHGVPKRTALKRTERKFGVERGLILAFVRSAE